MKPEEITTNTNVYFINRKRKRVGVLNPLFVNVKPDGKGNVRLEMNLEINAKERIEDFDFFFNEKEWIEEVKTLNQ